MSEPNPTVEGTSLRSTPEAEAARRKARESNQKKGLVIVHTGKGKGKTTAALGLLRPRLLSSSPTLSRR